MNRDPWLKAKTVLPEGDIISSFYVGDLNWQLYNTESGGYALAVTDELYGEWIRRQYLEEGFFMPMQKDLLVLCVPAGELISSVEFGPFVNNGTQALAFAKAVKSAAKRLPVLSADTLYVSSLSILLPCRMEQALPGKKDTSSDADLLLGHWICHGMNVLLSDTARIRKYASWLPDETRALLLSLFGLKEKDPEETDPILTMPQPLTQREEFDGAADPVSKANRKKRQDGPFTLPGRPKLEKFFREEIIDIIDREEEYARFGVGFPGATLFYGPSGSGKTYAVEKLADYLGWPVFQVTSGTVGSKYIHETSRKVSQVFDIAIKNAPSILIIDEMEAFLSSREKQGGSYNSHLEEVAEFLRRIPDAAENHVLLFGMTNMPEAIDRAILRKGRFDHILEVAMPTTDEVLAVLQNLMKQLPADKNLSLEKTAKRLAGCPMSDVSFVVSEAGRISVRMHKPGIDEEAMELACDQLRPLKKKKSIGFQLGEDS